MKKVAQLAIVSVCIFAAGCSTERGLAPESAQSSRASRIVDSPATAKARAKEPAAPVVSAAIMPGCTIYPTPQPTVVLSVDGFPPNPRQLQLNAVITCPGGFGQPYSGRTPGFVWVTYNASVASVSGSGVVTAAGVGFTQVCVAFQQMSGCTNVSVLAQSMPSRVLINPASFAVANGATTPLTATVYNQFGNIVNGLTRTWSTSNASVATVSTNGVVTGVSFGTVRIQACVTTGGSSVCGSSSGEINPLSASISGPPSASIISVPNTARTYSASVSGGNGTNAFEWVVERPSGYLEVLGTGQSQVINFTCADQGSNRVLLYVTSGGMSYAASPRAAIVEIPPENCQ
jgi:hypothetical protein